MIELSMVSKGNVSFDLNQPILLSINGIWFLFLPFQMHVLIFESYRNFYHIDSLCFYGDFVHGKQFKIRPFNHHRYEQQK